MSADYQASANAIYDPQAAADSRSAGSAKDSSLSDIAAGKADLVPYYAKAAAALTTGEGKAHGDQTTLDNMAGLLDSGQHFAMDSGITHQYASDRSNLAIEQANKVAGYDRQAANTNNSYQSALASILDKYNGQKAAYVTDQQNQQSNREYQSAQQAKSDALSKQLAQMQINANASNAQQAKADNAAAQTEGYKQAAAKMAIDAKAGQKGSGDGYYRDHIKQQIDAMYGKYLPAGFLNDLIYKQVYK